MTDSVHGKEKWRAAALAAVLAALLGHAALPGRAAPKPEPVKPAERKTEEAGGDKGERVVVQSREPGVWELPSNYRNADGSFNQQAIVAQQKMRLDEVNKRLMARMRLVETPHYLVFSDADDAMTGLFVKWCEALYSNLCRHFSIGPKEKTWDGKCILVVFNSRPLFQQFAKTFDDNDASRAGAYFAWESRPPNEPQLVHICILLDTRDPKRLQELFAHEGTHAFFQLYRRVVDLPLWLHEGLAEFMTVVNDKRLAAKKQQWSMHIARQGTPIRNILEVPSGQGFAYPAYSVSYTLVDFLLTADRSKFKEFIDLVKDGKPQEEALQEAYGFGLVELERRWYVFVLEYLPQRR
ncbi:MAG: hypothetical protein WBD75_09920 [Phycisphaerae bacterium]